MENTITRIQQIEEKRIRIGKLLVFACFLLYATSMAAKGVFSAESKFIKEFWQIKDYSLVSMTNTFYFIAYGLVQVILFFIINKINVRKYMICSIPFAAISMILMGTVNDIYFMWLFFGLTGAFQAGIFCGCTYILTENLPIKLLSFGNKMMNISYAVGTLISYGLCGICVGAKLWRLPYFLLGGTFLIAIIIFAIVVTIAIRFKKINEKLDIKSQNNTNLKIKEYEDKPLFTLETKRKKTLFYIIDTVMTFFVTSLFYMVMNYITALLVDVHGLNDDISIYVSMLAPAVIAIGPMIAICMSDYNRDFIRVGLYMLISLFPIVLLLYFLYSFNILVALFLSLLFIIMANGAKCVVLSVISFRMRKILNSGSYSAISNAIASLAAGVAPTITGVIIDVAGWQANYLVIAVLVAMLIIATLIIDLKIRNNYNKINGIKDNKI